MPYQQRLCSASTKFWIRSTGDVVCSLMIPYHKRCGVCLSLFVYSGEALPSAVLLGSKVQLVDVRPTIRYFLALVFKRFFGYRRHQVAIARNDLYSSSLCLVYISSDVSSHLVPYFVEIRKILQHIREVCRLSKAIPVKRQPVQQSRMK